MVKSERINFERKEEETQFDQWSIGGDVEWGSRMVM